MKTLNSIIDGTISILIGACIVALFFVVVHLVAVFAPVFPTAFVAIVLGVPVVGFCFAFGGAVSSNI